MYDSQLFTINCFLDKASVPSFESCMIFSLVAVSGNYFLAVLRELLIAVASLPWSTGSGHTGFSSRGSQALEHRLSSCDAWA